MNRTKASYDYLNDIEEILDDALNNLSPDAYSRLIDNLIIRCEEIQEDADEIHN